MGDVRQRHEYSQTPHIITLMTYYPDSVIYPLGLYARWIILKNTYRQQTANTIYYEFDYYKDMPIVYNQQRTI